MIAATHNLPRTQTLETQRLYLKEMTPEYWTQALASLPDSTLMELMGFNTFEELALEKEKARAGMTMYALSFRNFLMIDKETGITIGKAGFHTWRELHNRAELGYAISKENYKNRGLMKETLKAIVQYGFEQMRLHRAEAFVGPGNTPSIKLVEGLGFTREGVLRQHYYTRGSYQDSACYSLLKAEYDRVKQLW